MSNTKKYNIGEINVDLTKATMKYLPPYIHYRHELPLLSFGDVHGEVNLSLIFNYENYKKDIQSNQNSFSIAPGYKLNLQKKLIYNNLESLTEFQGANGDVVELNRINDNLFTFDDDSQRVLRRINQNEGNQNAFVQDISGMINYQGDSTSYNHTVEYPDFSTEEYDSSGKIIELFDKYGNSLLSYGYENDGRLNSITFGDSKVISLQYESGRIKYVTYGNKTIEFCYNTDGSLQYVNHYTGVKYWFSLSPIDFYTDISDILHKSNFKVEAISSDNSLLLSKELKMPDNQTLTVSDKIDNNTVYSISYRSAENLLDNSLTGKYFDVTNNNGVTTRTWVYNNKKLYSYQLLDSDNQFDRDTHQGVFLGDVNIYNVLDTEGNYPTDYEVAGTQTRGDGILLNYNPNNGQWSRTIGSNDGNGGCYMLSGWIKSTETTYDTIRIVSGVTLLASYEIDFVTLGEWHYFCISFSAPAGNLYVYTDMSGYVSTRDFRITPIKTNVQVNTKMSHLSTSESVLFDGSTEIPFVNVKFCYTVNGVDKIIKSEQDDDDVYVTSADVLRYKLRKKKTGLCNEVYYNNCKISVGGISNFKVIYNDSYTDIENFDLGVRTCSDNQVSLVRINVNDGNNSDNVVKTLTLIKKSAGEGVISSVTSDEKFDSNLDLIESTFDGVTTKYTRDSRGLVTSETINGLGTIATNYGTNDDGESTITVTDEFNNSTVYTLDSVWGFVKTVRLPNNEVITDTYDGNASVLTTKSFGVDLTRENAFGYSKGRLASIATGGLSYAFDYSSTTGDLISVNKNGVSVEHHSYTRNNGETTVESKYPSSSNALHTETLVYDKHNRLKSKGNILQNTYGITTRSVDSLAGKDKTYEYENNKLNRVVTKSIESTPSVLGQESFYYDTADRLTKNYFCYDANSGANVRSDIGYLTSETDPFTDNIISDYSYKLNGVEKAKITNGYDAYKRITCKNITVGGSSYSKSIEYDNTRVNKVIDSVGGTTQYEYDTMGRISVEKDGSGNLLKTYTYDTYGQLIREDNKLLDKTLVYEYNNIGNIVKVKTYAYTTGDVGNVVSQQAFTYDTSSPDILIKYGNTNINYNAMGCPITYNGYTASWERGKLSRLTKGTLSTSINNYYFSYNAFGQRIRKKYSYTFGMLDATAVMKGMPTGYNKVFCYDESGRLISEKISNQYYQEMETYEDIVYLYDADSIIGIMHTNGSNSGTYYFQRNLLGDVVGIYDASGNKVGAYAYDAFGNCTVKLDTNGIAAKNPIRYRGYYYDADTKLYYLNSRYYSPEWRRFISPDDTAYLDAETPNGLNLYCYCNNDPVNRIDPSGYAWEWSTFWTGFFTIGAAITAIALSVTTFGAGIPLGMSVIAGVTLGSGVLTGINGVATIIEAGTNYNFVRDGLFNDVLGVSDSAYNIYAGITGWTAAIGSMILGFYHTTGQYKAAKASQRFLGKGYTKAGKNRWVSAGGYRQVRWDTTHHMYKGKPSPVHFNWYEYQYPIATGVRNKLVRDVHLWLKWFSYYM